MAKEAEVKLSKLVESIMNYTPQRSGVRSYIFRYADSIIEQLKKKGKINTPFRRAALATWIRQDPEVQTTFEKAGVHKADRYGRISLYLGHWITKCEKKGTLEVTKDSDRHVWISIQK